MKSTTLRNARENPAPAMLAGVSKSYGSVHALRDVSLSIEPGELVALLGPNGAGKTTAVKLLLGLLSPTSGVARVFGADPRDAANRSRTGAMLQIGRVPETLRVREHIHLFSSYYPAPMRYSDVIDAAGLHGVEERKFGKLSGGQQRRLQFALAICGDPDLLILDEPTVGLDIEARRGLWAQIRALLARGKSVLLTTHYLEEADALADRVVVIDRGTVIAEGTTTEIKQQAAGKRIRCRTALSIDDVRALPFVTAVDTDDDALLIGTPASDAVIRELLSRDPSLAGIEITNAGLEEAFLALTGSAR
ncbi:MAG TPA: ABC transporter ATP-binding protein [Vicinamibacterales bacterium]